MTITNVELLTPTGPGPFPTMVRVRISGNRDGVQNWKVFAASESFAIDLDMGRPLGTIEGFYHERDPFDLGAVAYDGPWTVDMPIPPSALRSPIAGKIYPLVVGVAWKPSDSQPWQLMVWEWTPGSFGSDRFLPTWYGTNALPVLTPISPVSVEGQSTSLKPNFRFNIWSGGDPAGSDLAWVDSYELSVEQGGVEVWNKQGSLSENDNRNGYKYLAARTTLADGTTADNFPDLNLAANVWARWRTRGTDRAGMRGPWSPSVDFLPGFVPSAPSGITPSGLIRTLTPHIAGVYEQGNGQAEAAWQYRWSRNGDVFYTSPELATPIADGADYAGSPALQWATAYGLSESTKDSAGFWGSWSTPVTVKTDSPPTSPTNLRPVGPIGDVRPVLSLDHHDPDGDPLTKIRYYLYDQTNGAWVPGYNPIELTQTVPEHPLTVDLTANPATTYVLQAQTMGHAAAGWGAMSDPVTFLVSEIPGVTITVPAIDGTVTAPSFVAEFDVTGGSGTYTSYQVEILSSDLTTSIWDSGPLAWPGGTSGSLVIPAGPLTNETGYALVATVTDDLGQIGESVPQMFTTDFTPPPAITGLTATIYGGME